MTSADRYSLQTRFPCGMRCAWQARRSAWMITVSCSNCHADNPKFPRAGGSEDLPPEPLKRHAHADAQGRKVGLRGTIGLCVRCQRDPPRYRIHRANVSATIWGSESSARVVCTTHPLFERNNPVWIIYNVLQLGTGCTEDAGLHPQRRDYRGRC